MASSRLEHLAHIDSLEEAINRLSAEIAQRLGPYEKILLRLETIPGIKRRLAEIILAEIGPEMSRFPSAQHLASWAGMCPGNHESAGKRLSGKTRKGSQWLRTALVEAAHAASHCKECYLSAHYHHIAVRRGKKRAAVALGHTLLVIIYHVSAENKEYEELGGGLPRSGRPSRERKAARSSVGKVVWSASGFSLRTFLVLRSALGASASGSCSFLGNALTICLLLFQGSINLGESSGVKMRETILFVLKEKIIPLK